MDQSLVVCWKGLSMHSYPISISGSGLIEGSKSRLFVPRFNNKYEQSLYEKIEKKTGIKYWNVNQFDKDIEGGHLDAVSQAFEQAMKSSGLYRKINKKLSQRIGVVYFNMYGPTSFMNKEFQVKEMYQSDVFPAFLLNNHNITGYSVRLRGERNSLFQGLELARTLIQSGQLDIVVVGGVFQAYSYLYLTEMLATLDWQKEIKIKVKKTTDEYSLTEAAGFLVVESSHASEKRQPSLKLNIQELASFNSFNHSRLIDFPSINTSITQQVDVEHCYLGFNGRDEITQVESMLLKDLYPMAKQTNLVKEGSDLFNINGIKTVHEHIHTETKKSGLIHSMDRDGSAWNVLFTNINNN